MATIAEYLTNLGTRLASKLDAINNKLVAKGQPEATDFDGVPALIEAITTGTDTTISSNAASASDIRSGKKAYVNGSLLIGTFAGVDTSDATATESSILSGKTAYVKGSKVIGTYTALDTSSATASDADIRSGKTAYVKGSKVIGTMSTVTQATPSITVGSNGVVTASVTEATGYISGTTKTDTHTLSSDDDPNFVEENIAKGVTMFGKIGTHEGSELELTYDQVAPSSSNHIVLEGISGRDYDTKSKMIVIVATGGTIGTVVENECITSIVWNRVDGYAYGYAAGTTGYIGLEEAEGEIEIEFSGSTDGGTITITVNKESYYFNTDVEYRVFRFGEPL